MSKYVKYIKPVETKSAQGLVAQVYAQIQREMGGYYSKGNSTSSTLLNIRRISP
jgi:hypothetical protein